MVSEASKRSLAEAQRWEHGALRSSGLADAGAAAALPDANGDGAAAADGPSACATLALAKIRKHVAARLVLCYPA
jgi:hypothetical protein